MKRIVSGGLVVAATLAWASLAVAADGGLSGRLLDPNGNLVEGLDIPIYLKDAAGKTYTGATQLAGSYSFAALPPGTYELNLPVQCCMYRSYEQKSVTIKSGEALKLDLSLQWAGNLGTIGDDPGMLSNDMRAKSKDTKGPTPRLANGKPDLSGIWYNLPINGNRPGPKMKPWAEEISKKLQRINQGENGGPGNQGPAAYCLPQSATPSTLIFPYEFVMTPTRMVQITEFHTPGHLQIYLDGRKHPDPNEWNPAWLGHATGRWDGDTLVVDIVGFNEITPGYAVHSEKLHIVQRFQRPTKDKLIIDVTAEDPDAWTEPYHARYEAGLVTGEEILEWVCPENNKDPLHFGGLGWKGRPD